MHAQAQKARWNPRAAAVAAPSCRTAVTRLALSNFRNYSSAKVVLGDGPVVLTGPNGAGKTNLLEALSFLAPGRGLRRARLGEVTRHGADGGAGRAGWAVAARLDTAEGEIDAGTGLVIEPGGLDRRQARLDGRS